MPSWNDRERRTRYVIIILIFRGWRTVFLHHSDVTCTSLRLTSRAARSMLHPCGCVEKLIYIYKYIYIHYIYMSKFLWYAQIHEFLRWISSNSSIIFCATHGVASIALNHSSVENRDDIFTESYYHNRIRSINLLDCYHIYYVFWIWGDCTGIMFR